MVTEIPFDDENFRNYECSYHNLKMLFIFMLSMLILQLVIQPLIQQFIQLVNHSVKQQVNHQCNQQVNQQCNQQVYHSFFIPLVIQTVAKVSQTAIR